MKSLIRIIVLIGVITVPCAAMGAAIRAATPAESLQVLEGFKVELLRNADPGEGSWVAMTVDTKGRLIVSPQGAEPMLRVTLDAKGQIAKMEKIDLPVRGAMGLLHAFDSLYVNGRGPEGYHFYQLRDTDGDDQYDKYELLRRWQGGDGEHGAHGILLGADNKLYTVCGNFVGVPGDILPTSAHKNYADDVVLPRGEDGNGFGAGRKPPGGYVLRMDREGQSAELLASGQRNTYDIAFNPAGELFGFDSDMEWDWGMPWYRPVRAYHIVSGADHGFREGTAKWPEYYPDSLPAAANIGIGSPTGVRFGTGARFPLKYQDALFIMDWTYGRIVAVHLEPDGASYAGTFEHFVSGTPLNVTDFEIGQEGAMYFTTGGRGTQSGLYRVSHTKDLPMIKRAVDTRGAEARALRRKLEAFHGKQDSAAIDFAWPHLNSPDRWIRYAARIAIEHQPVEQWQKRAVAERELNASLTALLALARCGDHAMQDDLMDALGQAWEKCETDGHKLDAIRVAQVSFARVGRPGTDVVEGTIKSLDAIYPNANADLNREICPLLIYLDAPGVAGKTLQLMSKATTQEEQIGYAFHLRGLKTGWSAEQRREYFIFLSSTFAAARNAKLSPPHYPGTKGSPLPISKAHPAATVKWFTDVGHDYRDGSSFPNFIRNLRNNAVDSLSETERADLAPFLVDHTSISTASRERKVVQEWKMDDLTGALDQAAKGRNFERGKESFLAAQCLACHRFGNEGGAVGPDLTAVASRFSRADLLSSIIEPTKVLSEQYLNTTVVKKDGDDVTGRVVLDTDTKLVLVTNPLTGDTTELKKSEVQSRAASKLSPMPEGLVNILTKEEILDLLAYMESAGKKSAAAFK